MPNLIPGIHGLLHIPKLVPHDLRLRGGQPIIGDFVALHYLQTWARRQQELAVQTRSFLTRSRVVACGGAHVLSLGGLWFRSCASAS